MKRTLHLIAFTLLSAVSFSQVTIDPKSISVPRYSNLASIQSSLPSPQKGSMVYNNETNTFFFYNGSAWTDFAASGGGDGLWTQTGNYIKNTNSDGIWSEGTVTHDPLSPPVSGNGTRLMWLSKKSAFRAGTVSNDNKSWDRDSIGMYSTALGFNTKAKGTYSVALGSYSSASGFTSTALGSNTSASNYYSTALGVYSSASGYNSTAIGNFTKASGDYSTALGSIIIASGYNSTAMGNGTVAGGNYSTAMGYNTTANGYNSTSLGYFTTASGSYAVAMGSRTAASGDYSTAMGYNTTAHVAYSTAAGEGTRVADIGSFVVGRYNDPIPSIEPTPGGPIGVYHMFAVGNGTSNDNRSNAMVVTTSGRVGIGTNTPRAPLDIQGSVNTGSGPAFAYLGAGNPSYRIGQVNSESFFNYSIRASRSILAEEIHLFSDARHKRIIARSNPYEDLGLVKQLQPTAYQFIDTIEKGKSEKLGFIAQEVHRVLPEAISYSSEIIPNVYTLATKISHYNSFLRITTPQAHEFTAGDEIRLIVPSGAKQIKVTKVIDDTTFEVDGFDKPVETVFVFGKRVKDFQTVDYDRIFTLGISAIQQLAKENEELKRRLNDQEDRLQRIEASLSAVPSGKLSGGATR